ncbi:MULTISPECIES: PLP-dependent transferase [Agrobacterium]|jgi:cystathionine beta-lyase/cystathionine gamma-synthase|uniref:Cystathionine beta-lyase/cystathionine gamma-synthase n=1 Tax=Agrobacterium tumefaciens TaxID=358 RepID=A0AAW8M0N7_AGRTU|nr:MULTISPECIES: PLP-dependent transferase [Agrobacterium]MCP2137568.1 cystathionine beta-lyase/cystathionine gamma-synthase [Rhizobium sp. SLBN-94]MBP2537407.1 cystathionine beta-lyase/cystathionine gamma-synthase [Agrobacterium tumefaciens]MBP2542723.1 cystathionine beta-lyase/cystathionine gamma-synthase [Agrobacterium tumefaciens]MBP2568339.1 cystathionine beta-lyase/cystathionine gamma-synthase [Agrobacterium tumefaciens]MDP9789262.1 cystathionine beta-lyase/cystathionine gamma-synthase [
MNQGNDLFDPASLIVAHDETHAFEAVVPPLVQTSLFTFSSYDEMVSTYRGEKVRPVYTRGLNPTVRMFEEMLAKLEGAEDALGFASGMSAISSTVLSFVSPGDRIVAVRHVYPDAFRLFGTFMQRMNIEVVYVDGRDEAAVEKAMPGAKLFYMESPTSWVMEAHDVGALAAIGKRHGAVTVIDNSWASPVFQQPISLGVDLVVHSASKYLGGHSDVVSGVVAGSKAMIDRIRAETYPYLGGKMSPFDAWLLIRGLRTLPLRMKAHQASALDIATRLQALDVVEKVCHPGLANRLPPGLNGTSGLFSFIFKEGVDVRAFADRLKLFKLGVSWGGHESLIVPGEVVLEQKAQPNSAHTFGISARSVRLHVGLEGTEALWNDLEPAIKAATAA